LESPLEPGLTVIEASAGTGKTYSISHLVPRMLLEGILPDLFREGQGIVATGAMAADGQFVADEVLAKHDENYISPDLAASLKEQGGKHSCGEFKAVTAAATP